MLQSMGPQRVRHDLATEPQQQFTRANTWKQPSAHQLDEWIKMWYIYTMEYHSAIKGMNSSQFLVREMNLELLYRVKQVRKRKANIVY